MEEKINYLTQYIILMEQLLFKHKNYAIDVKNGEAKNEAVIQLWEYNGTAAQKFYLIDTSLGDFTIHSAIDPKYNTTLCIKFNFSSKI